TDPPSLSSRHDRVVSLRGSLRRSCQGAVLLSVVAIEQTRCAEFVGWSRRCDLGRGQRPLLRRGQRPLLRRGQRPLLRRGRRAGPSARPTRAVASGEVLIELRVLLQESVHIGAGGAEL